MKFLPGYSKASLEITQPVKQKLSQVELSLMGLNFDPRKENELKKELAKLYGELNSIDGKIPSLIKYNKSYKTEAELLANTVKSQQDRANSLIRENKNLKKEIVLLSAHKKSAEVETDKLPWEIKSQQEKIDSLTRKNKNLEKEIVLLSAYKKSAEVEADRLSGEIKSQQEKIDVLARNNKDLIKRLSGKDESAVRDAERFSKEIKSQQEEMGLLLKKNQELEKAIIGKSDSFVRETNKYVELVKKNQTLEGELDSLHSQLAKLNKSHKNQPLMIDKEAESEKLNQAYTQLEKMQIKVGEMAKESANLRQDYVFIQLEREKIKDELERTKAKLMELENKFNQMGNILGPTENETKKVGVELIPDTKPEPD